LCFDYSFYRFVLGYPYGKSLCGSATQTELTFSLSLRLRLFLHDDTRSRPALRRVPYSTGLNNTPLDSAHLTAFPGHYAHSYPITARATDTMSKNKPTFYELLGVSSKATQDEINQAALEALEQKDAQIRHLEAQLRACTGTSSQRAEEGVAKPATSDLKDELVRMRMHNKALEHSNKILRTENTEEIAKFSKAAKARKIAVDNEATLRKENKELADQLAAARSEPVQQHYAAPKVKGRNRSKNNSSHTQSELFAAQETARFANDNNTAAQRRVKELEAEVVTLQLESQKRQKSHDKVQAELSTVKESQTISNTNSAATHQKIKDLETETAALQSKLQTQDQALADKKSETVAAAQIAEQTAVDKESAARKQVEELRAQLQVAETKAASTKSFINSLQAQITSLRMRLPASPQNGTFQQCKAPDLQAREAKLSHDTEHPGSTTPQANTSQDKSAETQADTSNSTPVEQSTAASTPNTHDASSKHDSQSSPNASKGYQQPTVTDGTDSESATPSSKTHSDTSKPGQHVTFANVTDKTTDKSKAASPGQLESLPTTAPVANAGLQTPISLLKGQLQYARAAKTAVEDMAMGALEELLDLRAEVRRYKKFEIDVQDEFTKANKMYTSLRQEYEEAMTQWQKCEERSNATVKITADQFANNVDDNSKTTSELLVKLNEQLEPLKAKIRTSPATKKTLKKQEEPLKISARRNRRLRDIIKERDQELANVRIDYGEKWSKVISGIADRDSEIRRLKRKLHIRVSRHNSDAGEAAPLSPRDEQIKALKIRTGLLRFENTGKEKEIEVLSEQAKDLKKLKLRNAKLRFDLEQAIR
jgi:hypothetical protein